MPTEALLPLEGNLSKIGYLPIFWISRCSATGDTNYLKLDYHKIRNVKTDLCSKVFPQKEEKVQVMSL